MALVTIFQMQEAGRPFSEITEFTSISPETVQEL
jgi:DNA-binding Lrp family transcriptional regulator